MNKFKENLKELRNEKDLSQVQLGKKTGLSPTTIGKWENGKRTPSLECLITLAKFFGVTIGQLVGTEEL